MAVKILLSGKLKIDNYVGAVEQAGGTAIAGYLPELDMTCDGLVLCGGEDVHPSYYNEEVNGAVDMDDARDQHELALLKAFVDAGKPVFGVCRGSQLINVYFGGTLHQNMVNTVLHRSGTDRIREHEVTSSNSTIQSMYGNRFVVNSIHHQGVKTLGKGLVATMYSDDGIVEGFEHETLPLLAVQWHPERLINPDTRRHAVDGGKIFKYFIEMCENKQR